jgi:hypothetical protein
MPWMYFVRFRKIEEKNKFVFYLSIYDIWYDVKFRQLNNKQNVKMTIIVFIDCPTSTHNSTTFLHTYKTYTNI